MSALVWPQDLVPCAPEVYYDARTISGGTSLSGKEQVASRDFGIWRAVMSTIKITTDQQVLALDAMLAQLDGRAGTVMVPLFATRRAPWAIDALGRTLEPGFARKDKYAAPPFAPPAGFIDTLISAQLQTAAADRAAVVVVNMLKGSIPIPGMHFQVGRCSHRIRQIFSVAGSVVTCNIRPGLRGAAAAGATVNFTSPAIEMRLVSDDQGRGPLDMWRTKTVSLEFIEV
jgi:hypothetical protein